MHYAARCARVIRQASRLDRLPILALPVLLDSKTPTTRAALAHRLAVQDELSRPRREPSIACLVRRGRWPTPTTETTATHQHLLNHKPRAQNDAPNPPTTQPPQVARRKLSSGTELISLQSLSNGVLLSTLYTAAVSIVVFCKFVVTFFSSSNRVSWL